MSEEKTTPQEIKEQEMKEKAQKVYAEQQEIIEKLIADGKLPKIRTLTRKQRKELDKSNLNYLKNGIGDRRNPFAVQEDCYDWILEHVYKETDFSEFSNTICFVFGRLTFQTLYKDDLAEKN